MYVTVFFELFSQKELLHLKQKVEDIKYIKLPKKLPRQSIVTHLFLAVIV